MISSKLLLVLLAFITSTLGANLDVNDFKSVSKAHKAAAANLMAYYKPNNLGTIPPVESEGRDGFQWFEMGMLWGAVGEYIKITRDTKHFKTMSGALGNASYGDVASFFGPKVNGEWPIVGRWNDDIGWWGLAVMTGAEFKGTDEVMPNGVTFLRVAEITWEQMNDQISNDNSVCKGGVFWYRDRKSPMPNRARLLASVSSLQYALISAKLHEMTGDKKYLTAATRTYRWMFDAKLVTKEGKVYDGTYNPRCWQIEKMEHSYNSGLFLAVASMLYKETGDRKYLDDIRSVLSRSQEVFSKNDIIIDECEPNNKCKVNQAAFKGIFVRGLGYLYIAVDDKDIRNTIRKMIQKSAIGMAKTCNDEWECNVRWTPGSDIYSDVHTQNTALELFNTLCIVFGDSSIETSEAARTTTDDSDASKSKDLSSLPDDISISGSANLVPQVLCILLIYLGLQ